MAQQGKIEFSFWYSLAKWHRTVDRQPAAMRTCLKTAGKGNSTYCLQTWTHMSENAQNIAFFTRFVGAESAGLSFLHTWKKEKSTPLSLSLFSPSLSPSPSLRGSEARSWFTHSKNHLQKYIYNIGPFFKNMFFIIICRICLWEILGPVH